MTTSSEPVLEWLCLPGSAGSLASFRDFVLGRGRAVGLAEAVISKIDLVLEEVLVNVFHHAFEGQAAGAVEVGCGPAAEEGLFLVRVIDPGRPFNPLDQPPPDLDGDIADRPIGGLGILLAKEMSHRMHYQRRDDCNVLDIYFSAA
ncbi:ATP-binding protein [Desulfatitalea alkaliphila]|uniref:ATP-binding protein n=1 Tax=Desulfatitalea alkaliphila TaxID=2929485 RepID=A0AA41R003_9BACT|nr:ATP-binding protein [Desulfatitalea alkaliphila]MCJ8499564.1 ATP-binding protein [Desulfatitalea alkaliphila]